ncbi:hypothetical protein FXO37_28190 [Capsicum annuum]|nr:hypothetical protein FXO37_28190 [Capsicum annuum]
MDGSSRMAGLVQLLLKSNAAGSLVEDYAACLEFRSEECQIIKDCREDSVALVMMMGLVKCVMCVPLLVQHQDEEISDDDFEFAGNDVVDLLPKNIDFDVDEDIVNMEAQFEEIPQSSASEEHEIKSSLSGVNGLPKGFEALSRTLSMLKTKSPIEPPKYYEKPSKIISPKNSLIYLQELQWQRKFHQLEGQNREITLHQPPWSMKELVNPISIASQIHFSMLQLQRRMDPSYGHFTIKEKPDVKYNDVGGYACFIRVIGSEPVQNYVSKGARMVLPEFFRIEVFAKLNSAIGKVHAEQVKPLEEYYIKQRKLFDFQVTRNIAKSFGCFASSAQGYNRVGCPNLHGLGCPSGKALVQVMINLVSEQGVGQFIRMNPSKFTGTKVEEDPKEFVDEIEKIFKVMYVDEVEGVELAVYQLKDVANQWYNEWKDSMSEHAEPIVWAKFVEVFLDRFFPLKLRKVKAEEFMNLK